MAPKRPNWHLRRAGATVAAASVLLFSLSISGASAASLPSAIVNRARRTLNLSSIFGSSTAAPSYDRIAGQPVFAVTTSWGSPYLIFERTDGEEEDGGEAAAADKQNDQQADFNEVYQPRQEARQVVLYFLDPDDAASHRDEMCQLDAMKGADMRVMAMSLGKAIRQASNLGKGLPTGQPMDGLTGDLKSPEEGGTLRYKLVPPKRELYYAARCKGRERVGLFDESADFDAKMMLNTRKTLGQYAAARKNSRIEKEKARKKSGGAGAGAAAAASPNAPLRLRYAHMEGTVGIPVFHCPGMKRRHPLAKRLVNRGASRAESPLFFSYEDLEDAWKDTRGRAKDEEVRAAMPVDPPDVEVYNLMDVVSSIDRDQWTVTRRGQLRREQMLDGVLSKLSHIPLLGNLVGGVEGGTKIGDGTKQSSGLGQVTFVPSSRNVARKERITGTGSGKARLRPMRPWGKDM